MTDQPDLFTPLDPKSKKDVELTCDERGQVTGFAAYEVMSDAEFRRRYPQARARSTDPQTSHDAAASISNFTPVEKAILGLFRDFGKMHDEKMLTRFREFSTDIQASDSGIRSRRAELVGYGQLRDSGDRAKTKSGRDSIVWEIVR